MKNVFVCEDSIEGIFTGVYDAWESRCGHGNVELLTSPAWNMELFCQYRQVGPDSEKAGKVLRTVAGRLGWGVHGCLCYAACAADGRKGTAIYRTLVDFLSVRGSMYGRAVPSGAHPGGTGSNFLENQGNPAVRLVAALEKQVGTEYNHYQGFVRFRETGRGELFAPIRPKANLLPLLAGHFADRLPRERWALLDMGRGTAAVYGPGRGCVFYSGIQLSGETVERAGDAGADFAELWKVFCDKISIESRENLKLQRQNLALHFREYMDEFHKV